jgi:hypothetical protein
MAALSWAPAIPAPLGNPVTPKLIGERQVGFAATGVPGTESASTFVYFDLRHGPWGAFAQAVRARAPAPRVQASNLSIDVAVGLRAGGWVSSRVGVGGSVRVSGGRTWTSTTPVADVDARWVAEALPAVTFGARDEGPSFWIGPRLGIVRQQAVGLTTPATWTPTASGEIGVEVSSSNLGGLGAPPLWAQIRGWADVGRTTSIGASVGLGW